RCVPGALIMAPANEDELADMMATGLEWKGPAFIRYPRGNAVGAPMKHYPESIEVGKAKRLQSGNDIDIWAIGAMLADAEKVAARLSEHGVSAGVINARFAKPIDAMALNESAGSHTLIVTMEDHVVTGGFGTGVTEVLLDNDLACPVLRIGWPDEFVEHGSSVSSLRENYGLNIDSITEKVIARLRQLKKAGVDVSS
ncbi:MAG: transketolase C-terminal domain-containing protein, partial [Opitutales bacterium]